MVVHSLRMTVAQSHPAAGAEEPESQAGQAGRQQRSPGPREKEDPVGTERRRVRAAIAARDRDQGRIRAVTAAIGAASIVAGGAVALVLPGAASAQASSATHHQSAQHATAHGKSSSGSGSTSSGSSGSGTRQSTSRKSSSHKSSSSSGLSSSSAPSSGSGSGQVTSGGS
jgi:hypothetical protein